MIPKYRWALWSSFSQGVGISYNPEYTGAWVSTGKPLIPIKNKRKGLVPVIVRGQTRKPQWSKNPRKEISLGGKLKKKKHRDSKESLGTGQKISPKVPNQHS